MLWDEFIQNSQFQSTPSLRETSRTGGRISVETVYSHAEKNNNSAAFFSDMQ